MPSGLDARSLLLDMRAKLEADLMLNFAGAADATIQTLAQVAEILQSRLRRLC